MAGRLWKAARIALTIALLTPIAVYLVLLAAEAYSVHQASVAFGQLENLKIGGPVASYKRAVSGFIQVEDTQLLISGAYRLAEPVLVRIWLSNEALGNEIRYLLNGAGLRYWELRTSSSSLDGKLSRASVTLMVVGHNEMLGSGWTLVPTITDFHGWRPQSDLDHRIVVGWFHITSNPPGEGYRFEISSEATPQELQSRQSRVPALFARL